MRVSLSVVVAIAAVLLLAVSNTVAQENQPRRMSRDEAREYMTAYFSRRPQVSLCGDAAFLSSDQFRRANSVEFTDAGLTIGCENGERPTLRFSEWPDLRPYDVGYTRFFIVSGSAAVAHTFKDMDDVSRFHGAWLGLQREPPLDPTADATFQASLEQARASATDRTEDQRRAQVRAEAFVGAGRTADALEVYETTLASSPDWAIGHYNAALVAAELEQYELAITAMRRYLYLEPNAPDARAAQDQIYRWEALLE